MPNVMAALPNVGGALCSMPQTLADDNYECHAVTLPRRETPKSVEICRGAPNSPTDLSGYWAEVHHIMRTCGGDIAVQQAFFGLSIRALVVKI